MIAENAARKLEVQGPYRLRLAGAMTVSLLVHALIVSLQFGHPGVGLPSLELSWNARRAQANDLHNDLHVTLVDPPGNTPAAERPGAPPFPVPAPSSAQPAAAGLKLVPLPKTSVLPPKDSVRTKRAKKPAAASRPPRARIQRETPVIALDAPRENSFNMPAPEPDAPSQADTEPEAETVATEDPTASEHELAEMHRANDEAQRAREAQDQEARRQAEALAAQERFEAVRRQDEEAARQRAQALEAQRIEETKQREEAERQALVLDERRKAEEAATQAAAVALQRQQEETLRREREEAARQRMELEEKQRVDALRLQAERIQREQREAMELLARKQAEAEAARQQAAARERERQAEELAARRKAEAEAAHAASMASATKREPELVLGDSPPSNARIDALPRNLTGGGLAGRTLEQIRRTDSLRNDPPVRQSDSNMDIPRRRSVFGSKDVDVGLMMYVESWRLKIERNGSINYPHASVGKAHGDPVVSVAVRSDGSVEEVVIHRSSGRPELDEAVHRIVRINARYSAFPPELARRFDVIEIRRVWNFDDRLRILEEVR